MTSRIVLGALALAATSGLALAQQGGGGGGGGGGGRGGPPQPPARGPELAVAIEAAQDAIAACAANGYKVAASVLDSAGVTRVLLAADGAGRGPVESSTKKAIAVIAYKMPSSEIQEKIKTDQDMAAKIQADTTMMARAGALPIKVGAEMIGAIGVGGAPGGDKDEACATTALDKVKGKLK